MTSNVKPDLSIPVVKMQNKTLNSSLGLIKACQQHWQILFWSRLFIDRNTKLKHCQRRLAPATFHLKFTELQNVSTYTRKYK